MPNSGHRDAGFMTSKNIIICHGKTPEGDKPSRVEKRARSEQRPVRNSYVLSPQKAMGANRSQLSETHHERTKF